MRVYLRLPGNDSLKGKRQLVSPVIHQIRHRFNVSVAEVGDQDCRQSAVIGIGIVSAETRMVHEISSHITALLDSGRFDVQVGDIELEVLPV
jgi:uncharacterized protein YlxP (DUF503 family)